MIVLDRELRDLERGGVSAIALPLENFAQHLVNELLQ